jgi:hypothetical protein
MTFPGFVFGDDFEHQKICVTVVSGYINRVSGLLVRGFDVLHELTGSTVVGNLDGFSL